jgi:hypothetical protein
MKTRLMFLLCGMSLVLPAMAIAATNGTPNWGTIAHPPVRPHLPGPPPPHQGVCKLDGTVWASGAARNRGTDHMRLKLTHRYSGGLTLVYGVHNQYRPEEYAVVIYQTNKKLVHILRYYEPQKRISDDTGSLSSDCRHMSFSIVTSDGAFGSGKLYRER